MHKTTIKIKELISGEVSMGTYGLVELELREFEKEIEKLKEENFVSKIGDKILNSMTKTGYSLNLEELEKQIDLTLSKETAESLAEYIKEKRNK